jgi:hypothetical protein
VRRFDVRSSKSNSLLVVRVSKAVGQTTKNTSGDKPSLGA